MVSDRLDNKSPATARMADRGALRAAEDFLSPTPDLRERSVLLWADADATFNTQ